MLSRAHAALLASVVLLLLAGPVVGHPLPDGAGPLQPATGSDASAPNQVSADAASVQQSSLGSAETGFRISLEPNGDAVWTIRRNYSLGTPERREAFESVAAEFRRSGETATIRSARHVSEAAARSTGREMSITGIDRRSQIRGETGYLVTEFTWTNFARQSERFLYLDDVFRATSGTWFRELDENQTLTVVPPADYDLFSASPTGYEVSNASLQWEGRQTFDAGEPSIAYQGGAGGGTNTTTDGDQSGSGLLLWGGLFGLLVVAAVVAYLLATRDFDVPSPASPADGDGGDGGDGDGPPAATDPETASSTTDGGTAAEAAAATATDEPEIDEELLSDEERIERLLERNGGRMKQANIVTETDWSNAKVSQLLSSMDEAGRIDKLRIGRENLISFPDEDVTDTNGDEP